MSAGIAIAIAAFGGAISQSKAAVAALEGIARNPGAAGKVQTPMIIALALIESLVIYAFGHCDSVAGKDLISPAQETVEQKDPVGREAGGVFFL
jgi:F0F1-type ATP synthase membrane subunit c/vacuolar-type H+-ATPase subunit K